MMQKQQYAHKGQSHIEYLAIVLAIIVIIFGFQAQIRNAANNLMHKARDESDLAISNPSVTANHLFNYNIF